MILKASLGRPHCSHAVAGGKEHNSLQCPAGGEGGKEQSSSFTPVVPATKGLTGRTPVSPFRATSAIRGKVLAAACFQPSLLLRDS